MIAFLFAIRMFNYDESNLVPNITYVPAIRAGIGVLNQDKTFDDKAIDDKTIQDQTIDDKTIAN